MTEDRKPMVVNFSDREALLMRQAYTKHSGHTASGSFNLAAAHRLEQAKLVTLEEIKGPKVIIRLTLLGREAWMNYGLRAGGRPLVRLTE